MLTISGSIIFPVFTICAARLPVLQSSSAPVIIVILFEGMFIFSCLKTKKVKMIHYERHRRLTVMRRYVERLPNRL